jgi:FtsP/CotA-like multicopper oxidase with cupredoxin domain
MNRRQFLECALLGASGLALSSLQAAATNSEAKTTRTEAGQTVLRVVRRTIEVKGRAASVFGLEQANGAPGLAFRGGDVFNVLLRNETAEPTIVHWHGLTPPWNSDGVGGAPLPLLAPGSERQFRFPVGAGGTHWMHAHTLQEQALLAAPLIVHRVEDRSRDEQEVVVLLHDFSFTSPEELLGQLKRSAGVSRQQASDHSMSGPSTAGHAMAGHTGMSMPGDMDDMGDMQMDLNDIDYDAYLANDRTLDDPFVASVERGGRVRVRVINGATATAFTLDFGELDATLIAVDGQDVRPIPGRRFPIAMGQRVDVRLKLPRVMRSFPVLALREGAPERTGIILRPKGAYVAKLPIDAAKKGPTVDLSLERQLRALAPLTSRTADRVFDMALTGNMQTYSWGLEMPVPIKVSRGDRVEVTMRNTSMMAHPMHLHGHHFQVVAIDGERFAGAVRDTVHIPPQRSLTIAINTENPGQWAFHCHHLYHMAAGMMGRFAYAV